MTRSDRWTDFSQLPDESRVWIHGVERPLNPEAVSTLELKLAEFFSGWSSHGRPVLAGFTVVENRFLVTAAYCETGLSGCGIDAYFRVLQDLRDRDGIDVLDRNLVFHRRPDGEIQATPHLDFYALVENGEIEPQTPVFNTLIETLGKLRTSRFELPFGESWHSRTYSPAEVETGS